MLSLAFFNNKGGVGKTTLTCNMASYLAMEMGQRVLVIDLDPQCNASQLLLNDKQWDQLYSNRRESARKTVMKCLRKIRAGDSDVDTDVEVVKSRRFKVDLLPGHPSLSIVEDRLSVSWVDFQAGDLGGARRSHWVATLADSMDYDVVVFDVGPSLGALNRCVLLGSDRFVTPMAADLFSLYALDNISEWISSWTKDYLRGYASLIERQEYDPAEYGIRSTPRTAGAFAGYTVQQYVTKNTGGQLRSVNAYDRYRRQIPDRVEALSGLRADDVIDLDLGLVPNMFSMVPLAQAVHAPISELRTSDGVRGAQVSQQARYAEKLSEIGARVAENIGLA
jgi:cellulose biosynthesis protein BcsQ